MTRHASPGSSRVLFGSLLCAGALLVTSACSALVMGESADPSGSASSAGTRSAKPSKQPPSPTAPAALTDAQARAALVSWADLGEPWAPTQGAATWRDAFLKATAAQPDCARLLEALYTDELLGAPGRAAVGLDDDWDEAQLRHQVAVRPRAEVDRALEWLATLPDTCSGFTAKAARDRALQVTVSDLPLPEAGDARQGLLVTVTDEEGDEPVTLTLLAAAVRVGDDAFTVTGGGLGDVPPEAVDAVVDLGARRLAEVRRQARVQV
ncbi:hypothetical protein ACIQ6Y_14245 [Streptomyces sp. NPDC096205]|uniref:hypothetical protein n=1 Tax=Streptomyces sp. NPDC096205 TaxID=3366081 RepID=UPI003816D5CD